MHRNRIVFLGLFGIFLSPASAWSADSDSQFAELKAENARLRRERIVLEARVRVLHEQLQKARSNEVDARIVLETLEFRCKELQDELKLVKTQKSGASFVPVSRQKPVIEFVEPTPEQVKKLGPVSGKITAIARNGTLMQISIGAESGIREGQRLEVFRLGTTKSSPLYLGTLTLVRVEEKASLGQFLSVPGFDRRARVGDEAATELFVK